MDIFRLMKDNRQEQIAFYADKNVYLRAIMAIHSTALGPAIGGIRILKYQNVKAAVFDLLRLSRAMTLKTAAAGLNFGGGEVVICEQEGMQKTEPLFRAIGRFIESFKGRFIAAEDVGVTEECIEFMRMETRYVTGLPAYYGGSGNHSYMGAWGTFMGLLAAAKYRWDSENLDDRRIIIQGYGRVGRYMARFTKEKGARVLVADVHPDKAAQAQADGFETIPAENCDREKCDIFSPCAIGPIIRPETADRFQCEIIAGSANNQLLNEDDDHRLRRRNILYVPDFIINVGGTIDVAEEYLGYNADKVSRKTEHIFDRTIEILRQADQMDITTNRAAIQFAYRRIESIKQIRGTFLGKGKI
ncbi:MAG: Glu/Leu/Phe/Val dehydrogenase [Acidobacteria bacterium]|nr:Glu/Leu/Phe/Val dehydrogenase [Acidobacteriota bacterium]